MTEETQAQAPSIQLQDLVIAVQAIDMASAKGVYVGGDMETVGRVRNTIAAFVQANTPTEEKATEESEETEEA
jgi:hypothetical protein